MTRFLMDTTSSITVQSLGNIAQCAPAVGQKMWCLFFYRQHAAKRQTAGIKFTQRPKIRFFNPQRRLVAPIHVKLGRDDGHVSPLGCAKFHLNRHRGVGMRPKEKYQKFPLFRKQSPRRGDSLDRFRKFVRPDLRITILH